MSDLKAPYPGEWFEDCQCGHPWMLHDGDDDGNPSCGVEGCPCGPGRYEFAARLAASVKRHLVILDRLHDQPEDGGA